MSRIVKFVGIMLCCLLTAACVGDANVSSEFQQSVKNFNRMLRWREMENAGVLYMEPDQRDAFLTSAEALKKKDITITDYRILYTELLLKKNSGSALVEFEYFIMPSNKIRKVTYKQDWVYRNVSDKEDSKEKAWKLKSGLPAFD